MKVLLKQLRLQHLTQIRHRAAQKSAKSCCAIVLSSRGGIWLNTTHMHLFFTFTPIQGSLNSIGSPHQAIAPNPSSIQLIFNPWFGQKLAFLPSMCTHDIKRSHHLIPEFAIVNP
jgi:hypothetical protein